MAIVDLHPSKKSIDHHLNLTPFTSHKTDLTYEQGSSMEPIFNNRISETQQKLLQTVTKIFIRDHYS